jgi:hypothetical protein
MDEKVIGLINRKKHKVAEALYEEAVFQIIQKEYLEPDGLPPKFEEHYSPKIVVDFSNYQFKSGFYAIYNDKEYRLFKLRDGNWRLVSNDPDDLKNGFEPKDGAYKKMVAANKLQTVYKINTTIVYRGQQFELGLEGKDKVQLIKRDCNMKLVQQLQLEMVDYREYEKWVAKDQIEDVLVERVIE